MNSYDLLSKNQSNKDIQSINFDRDSMKDNLKSVDKDDKSINKLCNSKILDSSKTSLELNKSNQEEDNNITLVDIVYKMLIIEELMNETLV